MKAIKTDNFKQIMYCIRFGVYDQEIQLFVHYGHNENISFQKNGLSVPGLD